MKENCSIIQSKIDILQKKLSKDEIYKLRERNKILYNNIKKFAYKKNYGL